MEGGTKSQKVVPETNFLPFEMNSLPDFVKQKATTELKETPEYAVEELNKLKDLISSPDSTICLEFREDFLKMFLRHSKYEAKRAFVQLRNFVHFKRKYSGLFRGLPDDYFATKTSSWCTSVLPYRTPDGCTVVVTELGKWDPAELSINDFKLLLIAIFTQTLRDPMTQINGFKIILDFKGTSIKHLRHCTPQNLIFHYHAAFNCIPGRYKEVHMVNESILLMPLWAIVRNIISKKMKSRIFFHPEPENLLNHFPRSILPTQYGGDLVSYSDGHRLRKINRDHGNSPLEGDSNYF